jgi:two-component system C4-dicarboxylate transport sensor histidine kinase DctB
VSRLEDAGALLATRIAARTAHDLNNLAAVLSGHIYLLRNGAEPPEEAYEAMEKALAHLDRLARGLTSLGGIGLEEPVAVDVNEVARAAAQVVTGPVELDLTTPLPSARGSRTDLCVALEALLANARDAAGPGASVRLASCVEGDSIVVSVEDSGPGVALAVRQRNFDPFFSTKGDKGRGIGLTIAALVAAIYGGKLTVEDREESGTVASLRLPSASV